MVNQKGFIPIFVIIGLIILGLFGGVYYFYTNKTQSQYLNPGDGCGGGFMTYAPGKKEDTRTCAPGYFCQEKIIDGGGICSPIVNQESYLTPAASPLAWINNKEYLCTWEPDGCTKVNALSGVHLPCDSSSAPNCTLPANMQCGFISINGSSTCELVPIPTAKVKEKQISDGDQLITIKPAQGPLLLPDQESTIQFGRSGTSAAVPDLIFGDSYNLNDIHNINYLSVHKEVSFYNNGYFIDLKNTGCKTETRFTDVPEVWVTECSLQINSRQTAPIKTDVQSITKQIDTVEGFKGAINDNPERVLVYLEIPKLWIQNLLSKDGSQIVSIASGTMTSTNAKQPWDITFITGYGIDTIRFMPDEIWSKASKETTIGQLQIKASVKDFTCKNLFTNPNGQTTNECKNIPLEISVKQASDSSSLVKIINYSE